MTQNPFKIYEEKFKPSVAVKSDNDFIADEAAAPPTATKGFFGLALPAKRLIGWLVFLLIAVLLIFLKLSYLQLIRGDYYHQLAEGNRLRILEIPANRGLIYDCHQTPLVKNNQNLVLAIIPVDLPKAASAREALIEKVVEILGFAQLRDEIKNIINQAPLYSYQPIVVAENLTYDQAVLTKIASADFSGLTLLVGSRRQYLQSDSIPTLSHLLGYLGKINDDDFKNYPTADYSLTDFLGRVGLELSYEPTLRGQKGKSKVEVDALGDRKETLAYQDPQAGSDLILGLDLTFQEKLANILTKYLRAFGKKRGAAIVLNPQNGEILALVSLPSFNNNDFTFGISSEKFQELMNNPHQPLFNRAISGAYPSGSTIKPVLAAAALQEGLITSRTTFLSTGGLWIGDKWFFPDWKAGGHGLTNVYKALAESVNTFFYIIGGGYKDIKGLGLDRLLEYYQLAGVGSKLGIDLPGEASGLLPTEAWKKATKGEDWYIGDTYHLSIGQGDILVTPLQVASWTVMVANGGKLYQPHLVKKIINPNTGESFAIKPKVLSADFFSPENLKIVRAGMRQVVTAGSAPSLSDLPISVAGKTGTAEWSSKNPPHAWFTGFAPYENPEIVITVLIEEGGEGSTVAVPVAKEFLTWWAQRH